MPGNLNNCKFLLQSNNELVDFKALLVICFEGNTENDDKPTIFGHLMQVTNEVVMWWYKLDMTSCFDGVIDELRQGGMNYYTENESVYINFEKSVVKIPIYASVYGYYC